MSVSLKNSGPIKIMQYGEGNFLRAFADYMVDVANESGVFDGSVAIVKPIAGGSLDAFRRQGNRYTVCLRGLRDGRVVDERRRISCVAKALDSYAQYGEYMALAELPELEFVISNTTEAGIVFDPTCSCEDAPPVSFPAKLTQFLHQRYRHFEGDPAKGLVMLPVELIEDNGKKLRACVLRYIEQWKLEEGFLSWVETACTFCSTLVDRIVTGHPQNDAASMQASLGYRDELLDVAEPFGLWVIESERDISERLPLHKAGQPVVFTKDQRPYRERKVRILNGAHTSTILAAYLAELDTVGECMADPQMFGFMERAVLDCIVPNVPMPRAEAEAFAQSVFERFRNPFIRHECLSISLNSVSKWKARVLPSLKDFLFATGKLPAPLVFSLSALLAFYTVEREDGGNVFGSRGGRPYPIRDNPEVLDFFHAHSKNDTEEYVRLALKNESLWGENLDGLSDLTETVNRHLEAIRRDGIRQAISEVF